MKITAEPLSNLTVARYGKLRQVLDFEPAYQREGGVWARETRSRLIDSIINGFDVPKLYFERATTRRRTQAGRTIQYAVLDGKQRLESIAEFLDDELALPADFRYYEDDDVEAANLTFTRLKTQYPMLAQRVLDYELPIIRVTADSIDLIEEMFQRLNASTALNHAERRNSVSGPTRDAANALATHPLLKDRSPIKSARYKHRELAAKFLAIEHQFATLGRISDTKAATLYDLFIASRSNPPRIDASAMSSYRDQASATLDRMAVLFEDSDPLLASIGTLVVYYIVMRDATVSEGVTRSLLTRFEELRRLASRMGEDDIGFSRAANNRLREYNVLVQSTNDGSALTRRAIILAAFLSGRRDGDELTSLDSLDESDDPSADMGEE